MINIGTYPVFTDLPTKTSRSSIFKVTQSWLQFFQKVDNVSYPLDSDLNNWDWPLSIYCEEIVPFY